MVHPLPLALVMLCDAPVQLAVSLLQLGRQKVDAGTLGEQGRRTGQRWAATQTRTLRREQRFSLARAGGRRGSCWHRPSSNARVDLTPTLLQNRLPGGGRGQEQGRRVGGGTSGRQPPCCISRAPWPVAPPPVSSCGENSRGATSGLSVPGSTFPPIYSRAPKTHFGCCVLHRHSVGHHKTSAESLGTTGLRLDCPQGGHDSPAALSEGKLSGAQKASLLRQPPPPTRGPGRLWLCISALSVVPQARLLLWPSDWPGPPLWTAGGAVGW